MDALRNLTNNIPVWQRRLDELSSQIDQRQIELAQLAEASPKSAEVRSLRNKGSTESLKPTDDGPMHMVFDHSAPQPPRGPTAPPVLATPGQTITTARGAAQQQQEQQQQQQQQQQQRNVTSADATIQSHPRPTSPGARIHPGESPLNQPIPQHPVASPVADAIHDISNTNTTTPNGLPVAEATTTTTTPTTTTSMATTINAANIVSAAPGAALRCHPPRTKKRTASVASVEGPHDGKQYRPTSITRSMLIVYYDSYVQGFFDDMVRFISSSRNLMRRAKMAAKVAQIKRLAEAETPGGDGQRGDDKNPLTETLPSLRFISSRQLGASTLRYGPIGANSGPPDVYDELDKALEFVQSTCEHGAHQFLRDAKCNEELKKIQKRMDEVLETATKEAERIVREEPELAKESSDQYKPRMRRPISMSRNLVASQKADSEKALAAFGDGPHARLEVDDLVRNRPLLPTGGRIEVDGAAGALVKTSAEPIANAESSLPRMPLSQETSPERTRHQRIVAAE